MYFVRAIEVGVKLSGGPELKGSRFDLRGGGHVGWEAGGWESGPQLQIDAGTAPVLI